MARYSDSREQKLEAKYIYKTWSKVDSQIRLPESLTGKALLPLLDHIPEHRPVKRQIRFSPHFSWKSSATYAAAFVLIVALSALLGRGRPEVDFVDGTISPVPSAQSRQSAEAELPPQPDSPEQPLQEAVPQAEDIPEPRVTEPGASVSQPESEPNTQTKPASSEDTGLGGPGKSVSLGETGIYAYTYVSNDDSDPAKAGYPVTVNIIHISSGALAFSMDFPDMVEIRHHFVHEDTVVFVGSGANGEVVLRAYDIALVAEPREMGVTVLPGRLLQCRLYRNVLNLFTIASPDSAYSGEIVPLPHSTEDGLCVVTALDLTTMQTEQLAFSGASEELSVYNLNAYMNYAGEVTDENEHGQYVAHIRLDGLHIELRGEDAASQSSQED